MLEEAKIPDQLPVMVLSGATLFPHGYMPLFIFEQRYREMLQFSLERERMFCIGHTLPDVDPETDPDPVFTVTSAGLVRACVTHGDGTSHLMLSGIQRVQIVGWEQVKPFRIASVYLQPSFYESEESASETALEVVDLCGRLCGEGQPMSDRLREHLKCVKDPSAISDVVAQTFLTDPSERQNVLEMLNVNERLEYLSERLSLFLAGGQK
ncbi:MAG: hypothetical protein CMO55_08275 [Verrucomicrobiales bacterium]|nr:hypothetical protein [Verrucomicrobiales bacterium]